MQLLKDYQRTSPSHLQLYSLPTPNGQKIGIALEEFGLPYDAHNINIMAGEQKTPAFLEANPNGKIPLLIDPDVYGEPLAIMESMAILWHLARKAGQGIPTSYREQNEAMQWLCFQIASVGPMMGQFGHFYKYAGDNCPHPYPVARYTAETKRLLSILEDRLQKQDWILADYSIVDMATMPWVHCLQHFYEASEQLGLADYTSVNRWMGRMLEREAAQRGMGVAGG